MHGRTEYNNAKVAIATGDLNPVNINTTGMAMDLPDADYVDESRESDDSSGQPRIYVPSRFT